MFFFLCFEKLASPANLSLARVTARSPVTYQLVPPSQWVVNQASNRTNDSLFFRFVDKAPVSPDVAAVAQPALGTSHTLVAACAYVRVCEREMDSVFMSLFLLCWFVASC